jgi:hypothetical protein
MTAFDELSMRKTDRFVLYPPGNWRNGILIPLKIYLFLGIMHAVSLFIELDTLALPPIFKTTHSTKTFVT